ncbi:MAG: hypothetical protein ABFQ95_06510 [Pseudomonadota bacterium]
MSKKKVNFKTVNDLREIEKTLDDWVGSEADSTTTVTQKNEKVVEEKPKPPVQEQNTETIKFSVDLPVYLHRRLKKSCAIQGISMKEQIIEILENNFPES